MFWTKKKLPFLLMAAAELSTWIPLMLFGLFLGAGPVFSVHLELLNGKALLLDTVLALVFFLQHSIMIRPFFKKSLQKKLPEVYHRAVFAMTSGYCLLALVFLWQPAGPVLWAATGVFWWVCRVIFLCAVAGFIWAGRALEGLDTSGVKTIRRHLEGFKNGSQKAENVPFTATGPYQWVRHPLYFLSFLMIWSYPEVTVDRLMFNLLFSGWITVGAHLEEKELETAFGASYRAYKNRVPMLIPTPWHKPERSNTP